MPHRLVLSSVRVALPILLAAAAGCQSDPRIIVQELPSDSIFALRPSAPEPVVPRPTARPRPADAPRAWVPPVYERPWRWIVIHHSASEGGSAEVFDRWHRARGWDELGYHFVITNGQGGSNGAVQVGSRWRKQKWGAHCGGTPNNNYNNYGIGICLVGEFSDGPPSPAQLASLRRLVRFLADRYEIAPSCVIGHRDAPNATTACPGAALGRHIDTVLRPALERRMRLASH